MTSQQTTLFEMPESAAVPINGVEARLAKFLELHTFYGGLLPRAALADTLSVSRQRVSDLIETRKLEAVNFFGVQFVSGRSLRDFRSEERHKGGRGNKRLSRWEAVKVGWRNGRKLGEAVGDAVLGNSD